MSEADAVDALLRAYVACNLAKDALPDLPPDTAAAIEEPVEQFCRVVGEELRKVRPYIVLDEDA
jgi:hypothetical protein